MTVTPDKTEYQTREKSLVKIKVARSNNNRPGDGTELAVFAIDEALLELQGNNDMETAGIDDEAPRLWRDHCDRPDASDRQASLRPQALPPGGSGGRGAGTRELFDT